MFTGNAEILDDVYRHGMHDVFWCYLFERLVSSYVGVNTNNRNNEVTYGRFYMRTHFTKVFSTMQEEMDGLMPHERLLMEVHGSIYLPDGYETTNQESPSCHSIHEFGLLEVSSIMKAKDFWRVLVMHNGNLPCCKMMKLKGIPITRKRRVHRLLSQEEQKYLEQLWCTEVGFLQGRHVTIYQKVFYNGDIYKVGDDVVVRVDGNDATKIAGHWKAHIREFFSIQWDGEYMVFFSAEYYKQCITMINDKEHLLIDPVTGMSVLQAQRLPYNWDCIRSISSLLHKFMPLPISSKLIAYETKDLAQRTRLLKIGEVGCVPPWLEHDDVVLARIDVSDLNSQFLHAVIRAVDYERKQIMLAWLKQDHTHENTWKVDNEESFWRDWNCCIIIVPGWAVISKRRVVSSNGESSYLPMVWIS